MKRQFKAELGYCVSVLCLVAMTSAASCSL